MALFRRGMHFGSYGTSDDGHELFKRAAEAIVVAEESGFDALSVPDHVLQNDVGGGPQGPMFEAYTLLGAFAARTQSARLLALVSPVTLRNPALLAKAVTSLDVISGGRAVLGIGAGWDAGEHQAYGIEFSSVAERMDRLDEALTVCRSLFREQRPSFSGVHYSLVEAWNSPRPLGGDIPILIGGGGERRTLKLVAKHADACNVFGGAATLRHKFDVLERHCHEIGRDPSEITKTAFVMAPEDMGEFEALLEPLVTAGVEGVVVIGTYDSARIQAIGRTLSTVLPG
jgi:F420-dependent oxidoreductase-like protein